MGEGKFPEVTAQWMNPEDIILNEISLTQKD